MPEYYFNGLAIGPGSGMVKAKSRAAALERARNQDWDSLIAEDEPGELQVNDAQDWPELEGEGPLVKEEPHYNPDDYLPSEHVQEIAGEILDTEMAHQVNGYRLFILDNGIGIHLEGFGTQGSQPGRGHEIFIEVQDGTPKVYVYGDITAGDPTHVISLENASEDLRED